MSCVSQSIEVRHISSLSDKPIFTLIIYNKEILKKSIENQYVKVDKYDLNILLNYFKKNEINLFVNNNKEYPFGAFIIEIQNQVNKTSYLLDNSKISSEYFRKLIIFLNSNNKKNLAEQFSIILKRLE